MMEAAPRTVKDTPPVEHTPPGFGAPRRRHRERW
jgi:hypothetical protein